LSCRALNLTTLLARLENTCKKGKTKTETHFFISNKSGNAAFFLSAVGSHSGIENSLHWVLDVVLGKIIVVKEKIIFPENFNIIRKISTLNYCPNIHAKINGTTIVASLSTINLGVFISNFPQVIFSLGTAPE
jgi:predicted transposase YbfD/YdcC